MPSRPNRRDFLRLGAGAGAAAAIGGFAAGPSSARTLSSRIPWDSLRRNLSGALIRPGDPRYDFAHQLAIQAYDDVKPQAVAYCLTERDVRTVLRFAQDNSLPAVPRSGGHSFGGYSTSPGIVLDVSRLDTVAVTGSTVTIGPGAQQVDALKTLSPAGLTLVGGTCPTVCAGGFTQGGGFGYQARKYGLALDRVVSATVVLADGRIVRAAADENADLHWALRGNGGGNYGVVTRFELRPTPVKTMVNFSLAFPWANAKAAIMAFQAWAVESPVDLAPSLTVITGDAATGVPAVSIDGMWLGAAADLEPLLDQLVAAVGVKPVSRFASQMSYYDSMMATYGCADLTQEQCHRVGSLPEATLSRMVFNRMRNRFYDEAIPESTVDEMLAKYVQDAVKGEWRLIFMDTFGGEVNKTERTATAFVHRTAKLLVGFGAGLNDPAYVPDQAAACEAWLADCFVTLDRHSMRESYQNFFDPALVDWRQSYYGENYARLAEVKHKYDPNRFFDFARSIS